jgi:hypothetical protein
MNINQFLILIFSASAIWFVGRKEKWRRWGYIFGILGQPFWIIETFKEMQMGMFLLTIWYTYSWGQGIWNFWIKGEDEKVKSKEEEDKE